MHFSECIAEHSVQLPFGSLDVGLGVGLVCMMRMFRPHFSKLLLRF
jgi:hypothetical protein